ncbi:MAG: cupin domain-containing protein [Dialister sp.]|nr:cupin domain-containing protein [Dialister sp.]
MGRGDPPVHMLLQTMASQPHLQGISHWHDELECLYILSGTMDFFTDDKKIPLFPRDFLMLPPWAMHRNMSHGNEDCRFTRLLIHPSLLSASGGIREQFLFPLLRQAEPEYPVRADHPMAPALAGSSGTCTS